MNLKHPATENRPRLLVSVKNAAESKSALEGGAEIIDMKEPRRGSLGKADEDTLREIARTVRSQDDQCPLSAALGELQDWRGSSKLPHLPAEVRYVKLGFSRCAENGNWLTDWRNFRGRLSEKSPHPLNWVAVIYADWQAARAPSPGQILDAVAKTACIGVLVDTFEKNGRSLFEIMPFGKLKTLTERVRKLKLPLAVAGSLQKEDLPQIQSLSPQIVAIRSAACSEGKRNGSICAKAISRFRERLDCCFMRDSDHATF